MKTNIKQLLTAIFLTIVTAATAQVKVGNNLTTINANSALEIETTNKGLLLPRVALTSTTAFTPLAAHVAGMTVYNTATAGDVSPGHYYNDGTKWIRLADASTEPWFNQATGASATANTQNIYQMGNVGIGIVAPSQRLEVGGAVRFSGALMPNNAAGTTGQVLTSAGAGAAPTWGNGPWTDVWMGFSATSSAPGTIIGGSYAVYGTGGAASASSITVPTTGVYKISLSMYDFYLTATGTSNYNYLVNGTIVNLLADNDVSYADQGFRIANFVYRNLNAGDVITISKGTPVNSSYLIEGFLEVTRMQ